MSAAAHDPSVHWIDSWLDALQAERGAAENTLKAYARDLKDFAGWLDGRKLDLMAVMQTDIESYLIALDADGMSRATRARRC